VLLYVVNEPLCPPKRSVSGSLVSPFTRLLAIYRGPFTPSILLGEAGPPVRLLASGLCACAAFLLVFPLRFIPVFCLSYSSNPPRAFTLLTLTFSPNFPPRYAVTSRGPGSRLNETTLFSVPIVAAFSWELLSCHRSIRFPPSFRHHGGMNLHAPPVANPFSPTEPPLEGDEARGWH